MAMHRLFEAVHKMKAPLMMVVVQVVLASVNILYKLAASNGMNLTLVVAYRLIFATAVLAPLAFFLERKSWPKITWIVLAQAFFCGLFGGSMTQNLYLASLSMTSATYASAMANLIPAITFVLAVSLGLEKVKLRTVAGKAKVAGTLMGIGGAMLLTFYKGMEVNLWSMHVNLLRHVAATQQGREGSSNLLLGSLLAVASCFCYALWLIIQAKMSEGFPCQYTSTALMTFMGSIQAVVYALCRERDWSQWKLGWNIRLLTVSYSGIVGAGLCFTLIAWCVRMRGPVFVLVFNPLMLVIVALVGSMVLDEKLHLGSILGSGLIVLGLYAVLWGKRMENKKMNQLVPSSSPSESESIEIAVVSPNKNDVKEGDDVQELAQKESEVIQESFEGKRRGGGEQAQGATDLGLPYHVYCP
ncbi:WAT1-related protein At1g68170-like [Syzygium oleosum]|uniref:WAT1-related protein At1g68170-like n=1 Tax=Syzygium oleosum TaxID=219896 RepID=UPI0011D28D1E|nr:WAT1-related protein At1g68170-like [Syzygium oleosum]